MRKPKNYSGFLKVTEAFGTKTEPDFVHTPAAVAQRTKIQRRASLRSPGSAVISTVARRFPRAGDSFCGVCTFSAWPLVFSPDTKAPSHRPKTVFWDG